VRKIIDFEKKLFFKRDWSKFNISTSLLSFFRKDKFSSSNITIIIPIFNAAEEVEKCLAAVIRNTRKNISIILVNDASTDSRIEKILDSYEKLSPITVIHNAANLGYTKSINVAIKSCKTDVVLLNSDTEVTPNWTDNLHRCAYSSSNVGTVTPFSNNAGAFSAPTPNTHNEIPTWAENESISTAITSISSFLYPEIPTGNGFCLYIKRKLIEEIGYFDDEEFPIGYGEENDFCLRARNKGWKNKLDDSTYIFHARSASFGEKKQKLVTEAKEKISAKYPLYPKEIKRFQNSGQIVNARQKIKDLFEDFELTFHLSKPTILYVLHESSGGTPATSLDLAKSLQDSYRIIFFTSDRKVLRLYSFCGGKSNLLHFWTLRKKLYPNDFTNKKYKHLAKNILINYNVKTTHIRHLIYHTFDFVNESSKLNINLVLSFHDFYYVCPTIHLIDNKGNYCKGLCNHSKGECPQPYNFRKKIRKLKNKWINKWREEIKSIFYRIDVFVTTSEYTKTRYLESYDILRNKEIFVIQHGRDFDCKQIRTSNLESNKIKILCPGNLSFIKGTEFISRIIEIDKEEQKIEFHTLGNLSKDTKILLEKNTIHHGSYQRNEFPLLVRRIKPHFIGVFSITPETYCHVISEAWSCGVPVLVNNIGTLSERLNLNGGGGWKISCSKPNVAYRQITDIYSNKKDYKKHCSLCSTKAVLNVNQMKISYEFIYKKCLTASYQNKELFKNRFVEIKQLRVGLIIPNYFASYFIRLNNNLSNIYIKNNVSIFYFSANEFLRLNELFDLDIIIIQRHAVSSIFVDNLLSIINAKKLKFVYDLDDNLLQIKKGYSDFHYSISRLIKNSNFTTTSTRDLCHKVSEISNNVKVIPNRINTEIWGNISVNIQRRKHYSNILYMGTKTHDQDFDLVREPLESIAQRYEIKVIIIGITEKTFEEDYIISKPIPPEWQEYPYFVRWLKAQKSSFDFGIAPLADNPINQSKSNLKYLDYTALGIPGIYSNIGPYSETIKTNKNGILVNNSTKEWVSALEVFIKDKEKRVEIAQNAIKDLEKNYLLEDSPYEMYELINSIISK
jgi:GT2 family glycosyltransferase/glycosyltransferase involved in cell wall biosynthesis